MSQRIARINELLKREISGCIEKNFEFPDILVTIHDVETAIDLKTALVYIGVIGSEDQTRDVLRRLNAKRGMIQSMVMKIDESIERGVRILNILDEIGEIDLPDEPGDVKPER
ncbi:MAG: ribosome-binding factor A [Verrucomicrobiales bacterium]